jgi:hypothetical protein
MDRIKSMVDMAKTSKEVMADSMPEPSQYPYGLCISLCEDELEKLGLEEDDLQVGDMLHLHCLASVTAVSSHDTVGGSSCRVELQIKFISAESEDDENEEDDKKEDKPKRDVASKLYKS